MSRDLGSRNNMSRDSGSKINMSRDLGLLDFMNGYIIINIIPIFDDIYFL
jgi:hypothetical protein